MLVPVALVIGGTHLSWYYKENKSRIAIFFRGDWPLYIFWFFLSLNIMEATIKDLSNGLYFNFVAGLGAAAAVLAAVGTLTTLVEAASLTFLFTFVVVCGLAFYQGTGARVITGFGVLAGATASVVLIVRLITTNPLALAFLGLLVLVALFGRPILLRHVKTESRHR